MFSNCPSHHLRKWHSKSQQPPTIRSHDHRHFCERVNPSIYIGGHVRDDEKSVAHDEFLKRTNERNVRCQVKQMVSAAKVTYNEGIQAKRERLRTMLEEEDRRYEEELIGMLKNHSQSVVDERHQNLINSKQYKEKEAEEFVKQKRIQQYIANCEEIRPMLQKNLLLETKACQVVQINEKKQRKLDEIENKQLWFKVSQRKLDAQIERQEREDKLKYLCNQRIQSELEHQIRHAKEQTRIAKQEFENSERLKHEQLLSEENHDKEMEKLSVYQKKIRQAEYLAAQKEEAARINEMANEANKKFEEMVLKREEAQNQLDQKLTQMKFDALKEDTLKYLQYCNEMKQQKQDEEKSLTHAIETHRKKVDSEVVSQIEKIKLQKAEKARISHLELLKQIEYNQKRKLEEIKDEKGHAIYVCNDIDDFNRKEKEIAIKRTQAAEVYRIELLKQIEEMKNNNEEMKLQFREDLKRANDEVEFCRSLAKKFIEEKIDYLPAHPNWKNMLCECKKL